MKTMQVDDILSLSSRDTQAMLQLNNEHAEETSFLDRQTLDALLKSAFFARGMDRGVTAFLIALNHTASYANPNFMWFKGRRNLFVYVDRIIVSHHARGQGIGKRLYNDLFAATKQAC